MEIVYNLALLLFVVMLYSRLTHALAVRPAMAKVGLGIVLGATTALTMMTPIELEPGLYVDARCVPMALAGTFAGGIGAVAALAIAVGYHLVNAGSDALASSFSLSLSAAAGWSIAKWLSGQGRELRHRHLVLLGGLSVAGVHVATGLTLPPDVHAWFVESMALPVSIVTFLGVPILGSLLLQDERRSLLDRRLAQSEARYRLLADHTTDMISRFDTNLLRTYVSPASKRLFGYEPATLLAERTLDRIHPDDAPTIENARRLIREGAEGVTVQYRFRHSDGRWVWTEAALARTRDPETGAVEIVSVARDISARKQVEEQLKEASTAKSRFLANMSHELRTPLNAVIGFAELIRDELHGPHKVPAYREYAVHIEQSGRHLLRLISDVLDLSKVEAGKMELVEQDFRPPELIEECLQMLALRARQGEVTLTGSVTDAVERCHGDLQRLQQAVLNLVSNAVKFAPPGSDVHAAVDLDAEGRLVVSIRDTGPGISAADMEKLFRPFSQVGQPAGMPAEGTGLGLTLARNFAEMHGGRVWLESEQGQGTTAYLSLPASRVAPRGGSRSRAA